MVASLDSLVLSRFVWHFPHSGTFRRRIDPSLDLRKLGSLDDLFKIVR